MNRGKQNSNTCNYECSEHQRIKADSITIAQPIHQINQDMKNPTKAVATPQKNNKNIKENINILYTISK